jgi:hypothetical protein
MGDRLVLTRDVTKSEAPWLPRDLSEGEVVYRFHGATYGVISRNGTAISFEGGNPFYEVPSDSVRPL